MITILLVTLFLYFLLRYGAGWVERMGGIMPLDPRATSRLFQTRQDSVMANVNGVLVVAVAALELAPNLGIGRAAQRNDHAPQRPLDMHNRQQRSQRRVVGHERLDARLTRRAGVFDKEHDCGHSLR